jgi:hypothetical protein
MNKTLFRTSLLACAGVLSAQQQVPLTTIQDVLFRADGTRFNGTVSIAWKPFVSGSSAYIPQHTVKLDIVNGVLRTRLVPTTNATAGANYEVTFASKGKDLFTETWAVPPSVNPLKVRDVRVSSGTVIGNPPVFGQLSQIADVEGLENELLLRPMRGFNFGPGRAAMINSTGQLDAVQGNLSDCVRVDGSASPCSTGDGGGVGSGVGFVDGEIPTGSVNSSNATFTLASMPAPAASLLLYRNGLLMRSGLDYNLSGQTITFLTASLPQTGDALLASYRTVVSGGGGGSSGGGGGTSGSGGSILCSGLGGSTSAISSTALATCTIPSTALQEGDRIEVKFAYQHFGSQIAPRIAVRWGNGDVLSRSLNASESGILGTVDFSINSGTALYVTDSRGVVSTQSVSLGTNAESLSGGITLTLRAHLASTSMETMYLRYYSVVRYPATAP